MRVHPRITERHPELSEADVVHAWDNRYVEMMRPDAPNYPCLLAIGVDLSGRDVEMIATIYRGDWLVYHAFTPPTKRFVNEIGGLR